MRDFDELIRERAYILWEQAGRPGERSLEFWYAAIREIEDAASAGMPSQQIVEQGVLDADPENLAFRTRPAAE